MRAIPLALLAATVFAGHAHAASEPPWSLRQTVAFRQSPVERTALAIAPDNTLLATWGSVAAAHNRARRRAEFGPSRRLPDGWVDGPLVYGPPSRSVVGIMLPPGSNRYPDSELRVAFGSAGAGFGRTRLVTRRPGIARPDLAGNARGDLALAWFEDRGTSTDRVMASLRRRGRSFAAPIRLATGRIRNVAAAVGPAGHVLVAWEARGVVRARFKPPGSRRFRPAETIRSEPAFSTDLHAAVARSGHAFVAWSARLRTEGGDTGPLRVQAAARRAGARFRPAQLLERLGDAVGQQTVDLEVDSRGRALVGWTGARLRLAESSGGAFTALPFTAEGALADLASGPGGRRLAVWTGGAQVEAAYDRGDGFGAAEPVAPNGQAVHAAIGPRGQPVVIYTFNDRVEVASRRG